MKKVAVGIVLSKGVVLACQRKRDARYALKWEFPGGKVEEGETPVEAVIRELREELAIDAAVEREFHRQSWFYPDHAGNGSTGAFDVTYFLVRSFTGTPRNRAFEQIRWVAPSALLAMDILEGNREALEHLVRHLEEGALQPGTDTSSGPVN